MQKLHWGPSNLSGLGPRNLLRKAAWRVPLPFGFYNAFRGLDLYFAGKLKTDADDPQHPKKIFLDHVNKWIEGSPSKPVQGSEAGAAPKPIHLRTLFGRWRMKHNLKKAAFWTQEAYKRAVFGVSDDCAQFAHLAQKAGGRELAAQVICAHEQPLLNQMRAYARNYILRTSRPDPDSAKPLAEHLAAQDVGPEMALLINLFITLAMDMQPRFSSYAYDKKERARNKFDEDPEALDLWANETFRDNLLASGLVREYHSEEEEKPVEGARCGRFIVALDPLDGSSNIKTKNAFGSILSVFEEDPAGGGHKLKAAVIVNYGSMQTAVYSVGNGTHEFVKHEFISGLMSYRLTRESMELPDLGKKSVYSPGGRRPDWNPTLRNFVEKTLENEHNLVLRYSGSFASDQFYVYEYGGIFFYPGKLRWLYEAAPGAFLIEQMGGMAVDEKGRNILDIVPRDIEMRTHIYLGNRELIQKWQAAVAEQEKE